jgi:hypothetical protein
MNEGCNLDRYVEVAVPPGGNIPTLGNYASLLHSFAVDDDHFWINDSQGNRDAGKKVREFGEQYTEYEKFPIF